MKADLGLAKSLLPTAMLVGDAATRFERVHSDTRSLRAGDLFVALRGERFDAHDFLVQAREAGAVAALAEHGLAEAGLPGLQVADTRRALGELATAWRTRLGLPLVAVTGSNGKTTVTQMIASILRAWQGDAAWSTQGNFNNDIGVPLTLLGLRDDDEIRHRVAVVELGMNHPGEIAELAAIAAPTVALVNNAQREHQEFMASVEAVARENGAVIESLPANGVAVFPAEDAHTPLWIGLAGGRRMLRFALDGDADAQGRLDAEVVGRAVWQDGAWQVEAATPMGTASLRLEIAGRHNARNALAATACALAAGCPLDAVVRGLEAFRPVKGRSALRKLERDGRAITLVDDSYNANPDSVRAAIDVLAELPGPRWLVLGDMGEVGDQGPAFHREVGAYAREHGIEHVWALGAACADTAEAFGPSATRFADSAAAAAAIAQAPTCASVLVKGSRFMKTEQVIAALVASSGEGA